MKQRTKVTVIGSMILLLFLLATDPQQLPSVFLITPFVLLFIIILSFVSGALGARTKSAGVKFRIGVMVAAAPVTLLVLQSLGQLTLRDIFAVGVFFIVGYFYISRFGMQVTG